MGHRGPAPKPTALKILEGNPGQRPLNKNEAKPKPVAPKPPKWLSRRGKNIFKSLSPKLEKLGLLTEIDEIIFSNLCQEQADMERRQSVLNKDGDTVEHTNTKGETNIVARPEVYMVQKGRKIIQSLCAELGLTVSARSRIQVPGHEEEEDMLDIMIRERKDMAERKRSTM